MNALIPPDYRICLAPAQLSAAASPALEAVFVGNAAANPGFAAATAALTEAAQLGFVPAAGDISLNLLPLAFTDISSFTAAFPGDDSWLARAVRDYFGAGGLRAWVVRVDADQASGPDAYFGAPTTQAANQAPSGVSIALQIPSAGLLLLPDLEYAWLASAVSPRVLPPPAKLPPVFRPAADFVVTTQPLVSVQAAVTPAAPYSVLQSISAALAGQRPDMIALFALPVGADPLQSQKALVSSAVAYVQNNAGAAGADLPRIQVFAPLLQDSTGAIATPSGIVAGLLCANAQSKGVWRSMTGATLPFGVTPLRRIEANALVQLRQAGIAALRFVPGGTILDDDIIACPQGNVLPGSAQRRAAGTRRLMGWLVRSLRDFGEQLVFENVLDDGRVELVLTSLFAELFKRGALTGGQVSDAVRITRRDLGLRNAYAFDITVATAVAVETIRLQFFDGTLTTSLQEAA